MFLLLMLSGLCFTYIANLKNPRQEVGTFGLEKLYLYP